VASMCAVLHQYRPVAANEGGVVDRRLTPILTQVWVLHWVLKEKMAETAKAPQAMKSLWVLTYCQ
jgi:hypothetical protein